MSVCRVGRAFRALLLGAVGVFSLCGVSFGAGTFAELQASIDATPIGGTLVLSQDYAYVDSDYPIVSADGILLAKPMTLDGNGGSISGSVKSRVMLIEGATGSTPVVVKNLTLTQGGNAASGSATYIDEENRAEFTNCTITKNGTVAGTHTADGGSIFIYHKAVVRFTNCTISENLGADRAAGIYLIGNATLENCRIVNNTGGSRGGGLYVDPGYRSPKRGGEWGGNVVMRNCVVSNNSGGRGAGIYVNSENDTPNLFENYEITDNFTTRTPGNGGGILFYNAVARMENCTIARNESSRGAGVIVDVSTDVTLKNCVVTDNFATLAFNDEGGAGLLMHDGSYPTDTMKPAGLVTLLNTVIKGNIVSGDVTDDVHIHWSPNDDKSPDLSLGPWEPRYDGRIVSGGGNDIGTVVNPRNFEITQSDGVESVRDNLPADHPDKDWRWAAGDSSGGCTAGCAFAMLFGAFALRRRGR